MNILVSSVGRRSQLIECFRRSLKAKGYSEGKVFGADLDPRMSPAAHLVERCFEVPRCTDPSFISRVMEICRSNAIKLVVPTIDTELPFYADAAPAMKKAGIHVAISSPQAVAIANDKQKTHDWLVGSGLPTVRQSTLAIALADEAQWLLPFVVKPRFGSASVGVTVVRDRTVLRGMTGDLIVQELAAGQEYTMNAFVRDGVCLSVVPHRRIEVRAGEVSKGRTEKNEHLMNFTKRAVEALPGAQGPITVQAFVEADRIHFIEVNARFGGGFPLAYEAGADYPGWLLDEAAGKAVAQPYDDAWQDGLTMLRYDTAIFLPRLNS
jgi:carbamoyl-phosphate synthase large subunit